MTIFTVAVFFLLITPGPAVLSVAGIGAAFGRNAGVQFITGLFIGTNLVAGVVASGVAGIILTNDKLRLTLLITSLGYLLYLAFKITYAKKKLAFNEKISAPGLWSGIVLQIVNPKAYAVSTTLFTGFAFWPENLMIETIIKLLIFNTLWVPIHFTWLHIGITIHKLNLSEKSQQKINIAMSVSMLLVVGITLMAPT